jgi:rubrerythrin
MNELDTGDPASSAEVFLAYAIKVEEEAALRFGELADAMLTAGNREAGTLFRKLSDYSKLHLADARARAGFRDVPVMLPHEYQWPDFESPEQAAIWAADPMIGKAEALVIALDAEKRGRAFYAFVQAATSDPEVKALADEFVAEESDHVRWLERWIEEDKAGQPHNWVDELV